MPDPFPSEPEIRRHAELTGCPSIDGLVAYVSGATTDRRARRAVERHSAKCRVCAEVLAELTPGSTSRGVAS